MAVGVDLDTGVRVCGVEGDGLVAHEVVAGLEARRDRVLGDGGGFHDLLGCPYVGGTSTSFFLNLEPYSTAYHLSAGPISSPLVGMPSKGKERRYSLSSRHVVVATRVGAPRHVGNQRSNVAVGPERPVKRDFRARRGIGVKCRWLGARDASGCVAAALDVGDGHVFDGTIALNLTRDARRLWVRVRVLVRLVECVELTADGCVVNVTVGCDSGGEAEGGKEVLHLHCLFGVVDVECC